MDDIPHEEVLLELCRFGISKVHHPYLFGEPRARQQFMFQNWVTSVEMRILGKQIEDIRVEWPADWWEALKERFAPEWFKARWPVYWERRRLQAPALYPSLPLPDRDPVIYLELGYYWPAD